MSVLRLTELHYIVIVGLSFAVFNAIDGAVMIAECDHWLSYFSLAPSSPCIVSGCICDVSSPKVSRSRGTWCT
jgi:hypothetical protein